MKCIAAWGRKPVSGVIALSEGAGKDAPPPSLKTCEGEEMKEFDYLIFVNDAKNPIAGFAFKDDAVAWVLAKRWSRRWKVEIRKSGESLCAFRADARGVIGGAEDIPAAENTRGRGRDER